MALVNAFGKPIDVVPENITGKFRESFENFTPGVNWNLITGAGDIVQTDGNAVSASYLVISKDPLTPNTETSLTYNGSFPMPIEVAVGLSMSQRALGQALAMEVVSTETPLTPPADIAISSISQTTTVLTVNTSTAHGLVPGKRIGIKGCLDSRLNYPAVVVATTPSETQFTVTAGPAGNISSATLSGGAVGFVYFRSALGNAQNGVSEIFENTSVTNASLYTRAAAGDALPSGAAGANQSVTTASTASIQAINSPFTYAFLPSSEYRLNLQADRAQFYDVGVDSTASSTSRLLRTQVVPDPSKDYTLRFRFTNVDSLPVPVAKIVSAVKSASSTATITTDTAHGLTTADFVNIYGIGDTTNFPNVTTAAVVASTPTSTTFTVVIGSSTTATSAGGFVARAQGSQTIQNVQTVVAAQASSTSTRLVLIGSGSWTLLIGDYVNVHGLRNRSTGADLGFDGAYKVVNQATSTLTLEPLPGTTLPAPILLTNTGGAVIKRTDTRIAFVRIFEYLRERVELMARPSGDASGAVTITGSSGISVSGSLAPQSQNNFSLLTSTNLGAGATYTGSSLNLASSTTGATVFFTSINVAVTHLAGLTPGTLIYEVGTETSSTAPTTWYPAFTIPIPSVNGWQNFTLPVSTRWYRFRFVNGATAQTVFRLSTITQYNGAMSNALSFPDTITYPLSVTNLAGGATFTGPTLDFGDTMSVYKTITAQVFASHASATNGFVIQVSRDATTWRDAVSATVTANTLTRIEWGLIYRYVRVVYTNGATTQTTFELFANADVR
jgi:hypothetical protein